MPSKKDIQSLQKYKTQMDRYNQRDIDGLDEGNREIWDSANDSVKNGKVPSRDILSVFRVLNKNKEEKQEAADEEHRKKTISNISAGRDAARQNTANIIEPLLVQLKSENNGEIPDNIDSDKVIQYAKKELNPALDVKAAEQQLQQLVAKDQSTRRPGVVAPNQLAGGNNQTNATKSAGNDTQKAAAGKESEKQSLETDSIENNGEKSDKKPMADADKNNIKKHLGKLSNADLHWLTTELKKELKNASEKGFNNIEEGVFDKIGGMLNKRERYSTTDALHYIVRTARELGIPSKEVISDWEQEAHNSTDKRVIQGVIRKVANRHGKNIESAKDIKLKGDSKASPLAKSILTYCVKNDRCQDVLDIMKDSGLESGAIGSVADKIRRIPGVGKMFGESLNEFDISHKVTGEFLTAVASAAGVKKAGEAPQKSDTDAIEKGNDEVEDNGGDEEVTQESLRRIADMLDNSSAETKCVVIECAIKWSLHNCGNNVRKTLTESVAPSPAIDEVHFDFLNEMLESYGVLWSDLGIRPLYEDGYIVLKKKTKINETISSELLDTKIDVISLKKVLSLISDHNMGGNMSLIRKSIFSKLRNVDNIEAKTLRYIGDELTSLAHKGVDLSQAFNV